MSEKDSISEEDIKQIENEIYELNKEIGYLTSDLRDCMNRERINYGR